MCDGLLSEECLEKYINHQVRFTRPDGEVASGILKSFGEDSYGAGLGEFGWPVLFKDGSDFFVTSRTELEYLTRRDL